jgi:RNA polymerase sigma factor (TIGR02999 family)
MSEVTSILNAIESGDAHAAAQLLPLVYDELRKLAAQKLAHEKPGQTLDATALVHEAYLRLVASGDASAPREQHWDGRSHFFVAATEAMRRILIDNARRKQRPKHGGDRQRVDLDDALAASEQPEHLLAVDEALTKFAQREPIKAELVKLRFFAGLTIPEAARALNISVATAERYWTYARVWLYAELTDDRPAQAIPLLEQTLKQREAKLGADHPLTFDSRNNLAWAYQSAGRTVDAICLLKQAVKKMGKLGADDPDTFATMRYIVILRNIGTAQERYRVQLAKLGPDHIDTLLARRDLAQMYMTANRLEEAKPILVEVIDRMKTRANVDPIRVFTIGLLWNCLTTRERTMPDSWLTFRCKSLLGGALLGQKKYAAAEPLLLKGYQGMKEREDKIPALGKIRVSEALERLVQLYEATGKKEEAAKWRKQLDETKKAAEKEKAKK